MLPAPLRPALLTLMVLATACGGGTAAAPSTTARTEPASTPTATEPQPAPSSIDALIAELSADDARAEPLLAPSASVAACDEPEGEDCGIASAAAWHAQEHRWIVLDVDASEGGPEDAQLVAVTPTGETVLAAHEIDAGGLAALGRATRPFATLSAPTNLVTQAARVDFSSSSYAELVALGAPLDGWLLRLSTITDLDHPEHVLTLINRADGRSIELAREPGEVTPCDGDGWTCEAHAYDDAECAPADLRAEGRLCVQPRGIDFVGLSDDHSSLLVLGIRIVAGDGGYPPHHWAVALPASL